MVAMEAMATAMMATAMMATMVAAAATTAAAAVKTAWTSVTNVARRGGASPPTPWARPTPNPAAKRLSPHLLLPNPSKGTVPRLCCLVTKTLRCGSRACASIRWAFTGKAICTTSSNSTTTKHTAGDTLIVPSSRSSMPSSCLPSAPPVASFALAGRR